MSDFKKYFERLLQGHGVHVEKRHFHLFDTFLEEESIVNEFHLIRKTQQTMIDKWKEKIAIDDIKTKQIALSNGTVGRPYEFVFNLEQLGFTVVGDFYVEIQETVGVTFNKEEKSISGVLKEAGEHRLIFNFKLKSDSSESPFHKKEIKLVVNPDPKSLWKQLDSDRSDPYWKENQSGGSSAFGSKKLTIGSRRGRSHEHEGKFRDDDFEFFYHKEQGWGVIAVADGAGSAKYSRKGSEIACKTVVEFFKNIEEEKLREIDAGALALVENENTENEKKLSAVLVEYLGKAAFSAQGKIREEAIVKSAEARDFSTTLIFAFIKQYGNKFLIASFWVGDGGIGIYNKETNKHFLFGTPDSGEFAGQTRFLTMNDIFANGAYANRVRFKIVDDFTALILMTDGVTDPKFQTDANLNKTEKWDELWKDLSGNNQDNCKVDFSKPIEEVEKDLMNWLEFWSPGNHDDRTIAILY